MFKLLAEDEGPAEGRQKYQENQVSQSQMTISKREGLMLPIWCELYLSH